MSHSAADSAFAVPGAPLSRMICKRNATAPSLAQSESYRREKRQPPGEIGVPENTAAIFAIDETFRLSHNRCLAGNVFRVWSGVARDIGHTIVILKKLRKPN